MRLWLPEMNTASLLVLVIALLSVNLLFVGFYIILVLREVKGSITRLNRILETAEAVSSSVAAPIIGASAAVTALTKGSQLVRGLKKLGRKREVKNE